MNTTIRLSFVAVLSVIVVIACDRVPLTSPTGSTISVTADKTVLPLGGQATVRAVVIESAGTPVHNGTTVTFQTTNVGSFAPPTAETVNGIASTTFLAGSVSGTATLSAFSGGARSGGNGSGGGVTVKVGAAAAGNISVSATPPSVSQSGGTVTISALVLDESSNPLPGVSVIFSANAGALSATSALTDPSGIARTQLTTQQTTTVTARAGSVDPPATVEVIVSTAPSVEFGTILPPSPVVGVPVTFTVTASGGTTGNPRQVQTLEVDFGDGARETRTNVTGAAAFTHTYRSAGAFTITARAVDVSGNTGTASTAIVVSRSVPTADLQGPMTVSLQPPPTGTNGAAGFTIAAGPAANGPPLESVVVRLDGNVIHSSTSGGAFTYQFTSPGPKALTLTVTDSSGGTATDSLIVNVTP